MADTTDSVWQRWSIPTLLWITLGVVVLSLAAGWLFGQAAPRSAASVLVDDYVTIEVVGDEAVDVPVRPADAAAPTSGTARGEPRCGIAHAPVAAQRQVATLAAGIVVIQTTGPPSDALRRIADTRPGEVLLAPNPGLEAPVVATAWSRRMRLDGPDGQLLDAFVTAYGALGPAPRTCSPTQSATATS